MITASGFSVPSNSNDNDNEKNEVAKSKPANGAPFPSPVKSDGGSQDNSPVKGHFKKQEAVLGLARCGPERREPITDIRGLVNPDEYLCYTNSVFTLLMNLNSFTGYLNQVHRSQDEPPQSDLLILLNDFARAY
jgi:hypothetical protein